jgi:hypothetical protein
MLYLKSSLLALGFAWRLSVLCRGSRRHILRFYVDKKKPWCGSGLSNSLDPDPKHWLMRPHTVSVIADQPRS